jgi:hypothetical protein
MVNVRYKKKSSYMQNSAKMWTNRLHFLCSDDTANKGSDLHETHDYGFFARDASNMGYWPGGEIMASLLPVVEVNYDDHTSWKIWNPTYIAKSTFSSLLHLY